MGNLILYKDSPQILENFASELVEQLKLNINARRTRTRYRGTFRKGYEAKRIESYRSGSKPYRASGDLSRSIDYTILGMKTYISFNEYGVILDRGADGNHYKFKQRTNQSFLYDADISYSGDLEKDVKKWIKRRGLKPIQRQRFGFKRLKNTPANRKRMEFLIQRSLWNRGQNATFWFTRPFEALSDKMPDNLIFGMFKTIDEAFDSIFRNHGI